MAYWTDDDYEPLTWQELKERLRMRKNGLDLDEDGRPKLTIHNWVVTIILYLFGLAELAVKAVVITWAVKQVWF